jgi:6-phosphogluconolactonase
MCNRSWVMRAGSTLWAALAIAVSLFASPLRAQFVYVANYHDNNVSGYTINPSTGALTAFAGSPFPAGLGPFSVAVDPSGMFAYVANQISENVSEYTIDPGTGALTPVAGSPFPAGSSPASVAVDPSGMFAYVANHGSSNFSGYTINPGTGALTPIAGSPFPATGFPISVAVDPSGMFAYVASVVSPFQSPLFGYSINPSTGALTAIAGSPFITDSDPASIAIDPRGKFAYVAADLSGAHNSLLFGYRINPSTGALTAIAGSPFGQAPSYDFVAVDPSGKFVYAANWLTSKVEGYRINPCTGALTAIAGSPFPAGSLPASVAVDPSGKFAYVANGDSDNVSGYRINRRTGVLTPIAGSPFPTGVTPFSVAVARVQGGGSRGGTR